VNRPTRALAVVATTAATLAPAIALGSAAGSTPRAAATASVAPALNYRQLNAVSCVSATACFMVGISAYGLQGVPVKTLTARWNGLNWSIFPSPNSTKVPDNQLQGVSCTSTTNCVAVGYTWISAYGAQSTLVEHWNGKNWSIVPSPNPSLNSVLQSVSCPTATFCVAVGSQRHKATKNLATLVEMWNGTTWSVATSQNPAGPNRFQTLAAVSCASSTSCLAVGEYDISDGTYFTLGERWNGTTWSIDPGLAVRDGGYIVMRGVSCPTPTSCFAVGNAQGSSTLAVQLNGITWSTVSLPGGSSNQTNGVSCTSPTDCTVVGLDVNMFGTQPVNTAVVDHWNGTSWSLVPDPSSDGSAHGLHAVSCTSPTFCLTVGTWFPVVNHQYVQGPPLVERWNGTSWLPVKSRNGTAVAGSAG
jgi:hypothetical protein